MHDGSVEARSEGLGRGSEFVVRLPLCCQPANETKVSSPGAERTSPAKPGVPVLVVDDNVDSAQSLGLLLRMQGHSVQVVHDGRSALGAVEQQRPAVVFLDIGMPIMDGYEVARQLRREHDPSDLQLVALTGWGQEEDRRRTAEAGFNHHIVKPVNSQQLQALMADFARQ